MSTLDKVREIVRAEVARANPAEDSHRSIERFILGEINFTEADGNLTITVLDEDRQPLPGRTIQDLIADLRSRRPTLFKPAPATSEPAISNVEPSGPRAAVEAPVDTASPATPVSVAPEAVPNIIHTPTPVPHSRDWLLVETVTPRTPHHALPLDAAAPRMRQRHVLAASVGILMIALGGALLYPLLPSWKSSEPHTSAAPSIQPTPPPAPPDRAASASRAADPARTGSIPAPSPSAPQLEPLLAESLQGTAEVIDAATLSIRGKVAPLFGVQSDPGERQATHLSGYLRGREVTCLPAEGGAKAFRCKVEGQDLSKVVLFNGGGRANPDATPDLLAAEAQARSAKRGLWANSGPQNR
jgi:hypothetical protein